MTMETIIFLLNPMLTYCITVDLGNIVLMCKYRVRIYKMTGIGKINRNYPVTREVTDQGAQLVISVVPRYSIENPYYLHRTGIGKINRNYPVTREVTDQGTQLVISVVPH